jgi:hypothetical protein
MASLSTFTGNIADYCSVIARQQKSEDVAQAVCRSVEDAIPYTRARMMFYDREVEGAYTAQETRAGAVSHPVSLGLSGYVLRTGEGVLVQCVREDPRYRSEMDDPDGTGEECLLAAPITDVDGTVLAVLIAVRPQMNGPVSSEDWRTFRILVSAAVPMLTVFLGTRERLSVEDTEVAMRGSDLFLSEALEHHLNTTEQDGSLLNSMPAWLRRSNLAILALTLFGLIFMTLTRVPEIVSGPVVVRGHVSAQKDAKLVQQRYTKGPVIDAQVGGFDSDVICFLPPSHAADIHPQMKLTLTLHGQNALRGDLVIDEVQELHSRSDPSFQTEKNTAAALGVPLPVVFVHARLPKEAVEMHPGEVPAKADLYGEGTVVVSSKPLIVGLIPGLSNFLEHWKESSNTK